MKKWSYLAGGALLLGSTALYANDDSSLSEEQQYQRYVEHLWESMEPKQGRIVLGAGGAVLEVPEGFYYLDNQDARTVLEDMWGNPPDSETLGMLFPDKYLPFDMNAWGVDIAYVDDGHVDDEDAADIDYSELLDDMRADLDAENRYRQEQNYPAIDLVGWAETPHYDAGQHQLYWAKQLHFSDDDGDTLNYNIRKLGREGFLQLNFIASMDSLPEINASLDTVLAMPHFEEGQRYADYNPDTDRLAAYGIGGLIAGKVLAKTGFFAMALLLLKKFWFVLAAAIAGLGKLLFRKK